MSERFDAIVIGTGQAGPSLAVRLAGAGGRVAICGRGRFGGTCVNTGCMPTKTLVASAHAAHLSRRAGDYAKVPCTALTRMVHIHPTVAELLPTIAGELVPLD